MPDRRFCKVMVNRPESASFTNEKPVLNLLKDLSNTPFIFIDRMIAVIPYP